MTGRSASNLRPLPFDPLLCFKIGPKNGREPRGSGLRLKAGIPPPRTLISVRGQLLTRDLRQGRVPAQARYGPPHPQPGRPRTRTDPQQPPDLSDW